MSNRILAFGTVVFFISLTLLWYHAAPSVTFHDSGEFAMAASCMGIPHPPGAPTWSLSASLFVKLGNFSDAARGTNLFSGLMAAVTLFFVFLITYRCNSLSFPEIPPWGLILSGIISSLILLRSPSFLEQSLTTEQYTMVTAFIGALIFLGIRISDSIDEVPTQDAPTTATRPDGAFSDGKGFPENNIRKIARLFLLFGFLWGLAIGNHESALSMLFFIFLIFRQSRLKCKYDSLRKFILYFFTGLGLGLLIFLYLPIRSAANPLIDWGNIKTWDRFVWAILRQKWHYRSIFSAPPGFLAEWFASYNMIGQIGWPGFIFACTGMIALFQRGRTWFYRLLVILLPYSAGMIYLHLKHETLGLTYLRSYGVDFHSPVYMLSSIAAGTGFSRLLSILSKMQFKKIIDTELQQRKENDLTAKSRSSQTDNIELNKSFFVMKKPLLFLFQSQPYVFSFILFAVIAWGTVENVRQHSLRNFTGPQDYLDAVLKPLPDDAIILTGTDNLNFMLSYYRYVLQPTSKRWVSIMFGSPALYLPISEASTTLTIQTKRLKYFSQVFSDPEIQWLRISPPSDNQARNARVFIESGLNEILAQFLLPIGPIFEVKNHPTTASDVIEAELSWRKQFPGLMKDPSHIANRLELDAWKNIYELRGVFFQMRGLWEWSAEAFLSSLQCYEGNESVWYFLGRSLEKLGKIDEAMNAYTISLRWNPAQRGSRVRMALIYLARSEAAKAIDLLETELKFHPDDSRTRNNLKMIIEAKTSLDLTDNQEIHADY